MSAIDSTRHCPKCQAETKRDAFNKCKPCKARRMAAYRAANPEKVKAGVDSWRIANKARANELSREWAAANPEKARASRRVGRHTRRARKSGERLSPDLFDRLWKLQRGKCPCCKRPLGDSAHMDHILPLALGGPNVDDNIQLLCRPCNLHKHAKHPIDYMQSKGFLL